MDNDVMVERINVRTGDIICKLDFLMIALEGIGEGTERNFERPEAKGAILILEGIHTDVSDIDDILEEWAKPATEAEGVA
jgi:hypothetical protein